MISVILFSVNDNLLWLVSEVKAGESVIPAATLPMSDSKMSPFPEASGVEPPAYSVPPPAYSATDPERLTASGSGADGNAAGPSSSSTEKGFWSKVGSRVVAELTGMPTGEDPYKGTKNEGKSVYQIMMEAQSQANRPFPAGGLRVFDPFDPAAKQRQIEMTRQSQQQKKKSAVESVDKEE